MRRLGRAGQPRGSAGTGRILGTHRQVPDLVMMLLGREPTRRVTALSRYLKERMHCTSLRLLRKGHVGTRGRHEALRDGHAHHHRQVRVKHKAGPEIAVETAAAAVVEVVACTDRHQSLDVRNG